MLIGETSYRDRVLACWLGKNIGGTLGAPFEWQRQTNDVSFYTQSLAGEPLPNDDLDIQLLWLVALEEKGVAVDAHLLSEYWLLYVTPHWAEYGTAKINLRSGFPPPLSGILNNAYKDSCGAFIRSEIWACIAPGCPQLAARYAYEDAIIDHGDGEGVYGEVFCATLESAAFVEKDLPALIDIGLSYIPDDCGVAGAIRCALACHNAGKTWQETRDAVLTSFRGGLHRNRISPAERAKGFDAGKRGWDTPSNIALLVASLLYGEGDFGRTVCTAVNCGEDTDCTAATAGAILGLLHGTGGIPRRWIEPVGHKIRTACLNLGELGYYGNQLPQDLDELTERTLRVARTTLQFHKQPVEISAVAGEEETSSTRDGLLAGSSLERLYGDLGCPVFRFPFFDVAVDYGGTVAIREGQQRSLRLRIHNTYKVQANVNLCLLPPEGWRVSPAAATVFSPHVWLGQGPQVVSFNIEAGAVRAGINRCTVELTIDGRPTVMLVPLTFLNGYGSEVQ